ncbi:MAG: hypothetical protein NZ660_13120 [Oscillatoriaceae bacterium SKYG93]|nr:hypothetical protein [Oscillatoriaceae bacterium SKYG93]MDW8454383.1 hypothetical protein [Oscillatoriaceae cyanobacterium SKYGB_i_bin93]
MRHFLLKGFAGILLLAAIGCGGEGGEQASTPTPPPPAPTPKASPQQLPTLAPGGKGPDFQSPMVPETPAKPPGLIASTPTEQRTKEVKIGRANPFFSLQLPPVLKVETGENQPPVKPSQLGGAQVPSLPELPTIGLSLLPSLAAQKVPNLPDLPGQIGPSLPPRGGATTATQPQRGGAVARRPNLPGGRGALPTRQQPLSPSQPKVLAAQKVPNLPDLPGQIGPSLPPRGGATTATQPQRGGAVARRPNLPEGTVARRRQGVQVPTLPSREVPKLPDLPVAIGPSLPPELPAASPPPPQQEQKPTAAPEPPPLPPVPQPDVARAVEVSGLVQVGNETQIIVKAPLEPTSRYVKVGQRLANGTVLVKRVEMNEGSEPVVILEENGIEVVKMVGEKPVSPEKPTSSNS